MKNRISTNLVIGVIIVIIAIGYIGNVFDVWNFTMFFPGWWTLFIIVPSGLKLISNGFSKSQLAWFIIGTVLLIRSLKILPVTISKLILPLILLIIGFTIIFRSKLSGRMGKSYFAIFSGRSPNYRGIEFNGASCTALFGAVELNLTEALITSDTVIDAVSVFGGVEIKLPPNVKADVSSFSLFGGVSEPKNSLGQVAAPTVKVNAITMFGGVSIK